MVKLAKHELKETATIVVESIYNLNTNKRPGIDHGIENKFGTIWRNKTFRSVNEAFDELNKFFDQKFGEGAEYLEDHEVKEIKGDKTMTKKYNYLVTKVEEYDGPTYYSAPEVLDIFEDKQKAIDYVTELVEKEKEEFGIEPEYPFVDNNSDAKRIYSVDLFYKNDEFPEEDSKTTFAIDRYEVK